MGVIGNGKTTKTKAAGGPYKPREDVRKTETNIRTSKHSNTSIVGLLEGDVSMYYV